MDETATSYQSMGESSGQAAGASADADAPPGEDEEGTPAGDEDDAGGSYKLSPLTTIVAYITKQSYMVALVLMMV